MGSTGIEQLKYIAYVGLLLPSIWVGNHHLSLNQRLLSGKPLKEFKGYNASVALMVMYLAISVLKIWFLSYSMFDLSTLHTLNGCLDVVVFIPSAILSAAYVLHVQSLSLSPPIQ